MKRMVLINLICSLIAVLAIIFGAIFAVTYNSSDGFGKPTLVISSEGSTVVYNGKPLTNSKWHLASGELREGHKLSVEVSGVQTDVGISENHIFAKVLDDKGNDVSSKYNITLIPGVLNVKSRTITLVAGSDMKLYDGEPLELDDYRITSPAALLEGHKIFVTVDGSITEIGTADNNITSVVIKNASGVDVTGNYNVKTEAGKLIVYGEEDLVIKTKDGAKRYDGEPLISPNWDLVSGELKPGDTIHVDVTGSQTEIGESENSFEVVIKNASGEDVTEDYEIIKAPGVLTVIQGEITVTSNDAQKKYDGTPLTDNGYKVLPYSIEKNGFTLNVVITGSQTEVGSSENTIISCTVLKNGMDVSDNFKIKAVPGTLTVTNTNAEMKSEIKIISFDDSKTYDGEPLTNPGWSLEEGYLKRGHSLKVEVTGSQTDRGVGENTFTAKVVTDDGTDVTDEYIIEKIPGELEVFPVEFTVTSGSREKTYDGTPLTCDEYTVAPSYINNDYTVKVGIIGSIIEVGQVENVISYVNVYNSAGEDVTHNFDISKINGYLKVTEAPKPVLTYTSGSAEKVYDGTPLANGECLRTEGELKAGHREVIQLSASITEIGKIDNSITVTIYNEYNEDVTSEYIINLDPGTLTVTKRTVTITSASAEKAYDGFPLTDKRVAVTGGDGLLPGHSIAADVVGTRTEVGESPNDVASVEIFAGSINVSHFYNIEVMLGTLTVLESGGGSSGGGGIGGNGGSMIGGGSSSDNSVCFTITSSKSGNIYLKQHSRGDYVLAKEYSKFSEAPVYGTLIDGVRSAYYLPSYALGNSGASINTVEIEPKGNIFALPYYAADGDQTSDVIMAGDAGAPYTVRYYSWNGEANITLPSKYSAYEAEYSNFVRSNYLAIDEGTRDFMNTIIAAEGFSKSNPGIINKVARYIQLAAVYEDDYDLRMDYEDNPIIAFLSKYKKGLCRHYASAATMLYRALGIPARYTEGFVAQGVVADVPFNVDGSMAHAWVEVYVDGIGWAQVEVTGSRADSDEKITLNLKPATTRVLYTGNNIVSAQNSVEGFALAAEKGYKYVVTVDGKISDLGIVKSKIIELEIYSKTDELVYKKSTGFGSEKFNITYSSGILQKYKSHLTFKSESKLPKIYDGASLETEASDCGLTGGNIYASEGYSYVIIPTGSITNVGTASSTFAVKIYRGGADCTDHFWITSDYGKLTVNPREIVITAASAEKKFDGEALVRNEIEYDAATLAPGDSVSEFTIEGTQKSIGESANVLKNVKIVNSGGADVTSNYKININNGTLKVTPPTN